MKATMSSQQGFGLSEFLLVAVVLVMGSILGLKIIPAYMEDQTIKNIFIKIAHDQDMQSATPDEIQASFEKRASIDGVKIIKPSDISVSSSNGSLRISASYEVRIPLIANASLSLEFNPTSEQ